MLKRYLYKQLLKVLNKQYGETCASTIECLQSLNLVCATSNVCNCPLTLAAGYCDCVSTKYYDTTVGCGIKQKFSHQF